MVFPPGRWCQRGAKGGVPGGGLAAGAVAAGEWLPSGNLMVMQW